MTVIDERITVVAELNHLQNPHDTLLPIRDIPDAAALAGLLATSAATGETAKTAVFWGPHPDRSIPNSGDEKTVRMLNGLFGGLSIKPNTDLTVILADVHGAFNGYHNRPYLKGIERVADSVGASAVWLSDLYEKHGLRIDENGAPADLGSLPTLSDEEYSRVARASGRITGRGGPREYVAMRLGESDIVRTLLGGPVDDEANGVLLVIGNPDDGFFLKNQGSQTVFTRADTQSGKKYSNSAPWIPRTK